MRPFVDDLVRRERDRTLWNGGIIATAFVAAGASLAEWTLPPAPTPVNVALSYAEVRYDRDWAAAWELMCRSSRSDWGDYATSAENSEYVFDYYFMPKDIDVSVDGFHSAVRPGGPAVSVALTLTSGDRWEIGGHVDVVVEDGEFRVCDYAAGPLVS